MRPLQLGATVCTQGVDAELEWDPLNHLVVSVCITMHRLGDWGEVDDFDKAQNDHAAAHGGRVLSAWTFRGGAKFWIITEADRSVTTLLLPEEY